MVVPGRGLTRPGDEALLITIRLDRAPREMREQVLILWPLVLGFLSCSLPVQGHGVGFRKALSKPSCLEAQPWCRGFLPAPPLLLWAPGSLILAQPQVTGSHEQLGAEEASSVGERHQKDFHCSWCADQSPEPRVWSWLVKTEGRADPACGVSGAAMDTWQS